VAFTEVRALWRTVISDVFTAMAGLEREATRTGCEPVVVTRPVKIPATDETFVARVRPLKVRRRGSSKKFTVVQFTVRF
jgi:hypothetical protein